MIYEPFLPQGFKRRTILRLVPGQARDPGGGSEAPDKLRRGRNTDALLKTKVQRNILHSVRLIFNVVNLLCGIGHSWPLFRIFTGNGTKGGLWPFAADAK